MKNSSDADPARRRPDRDGTRTPAAVDPVPDRQRIAKVMARAGLCSRRDAEAWIKNGRVQVNNITLTSPALNVGVDDEIVVDGKPLQAKTRTRLFLFNKPRGYVTTAKDPEGRPTIYDLLPADLPRLVTVGRLDMNTEGLLLLTNDGGLARLLELPATGWLRRYRVRAHGQIEPAQLAALAQGISVGGMNYGPIEATLDRVQGANVWLTMGLREGKNREIKRVLEHFGLAVNRLIRVSFGPFQLAALADGAISKIKNSGPQAAIGRGTRPQGRARFRRTYGDRTSGQRGHETLPTKSPEPKAAMGKPEPATQLTAARSRRREAARSTGEGQTQTYFRAAGRTAGGGHSRKDADRAWRHRRPKGSGGLCRAHRLVAQAQSPDRTLAEKAKFDRVQP